MKIIIAFLLGLTLVTGGYFMLRGDTVEAPVEALGAFSDPFVSIQLATSPSNGNCLTTNGTDNAWGACGSGGVTGGVAGNLAFWTSATALSNVATGTLTESVLGIDLSNSTRGLVGGSSAFSLTAGYEIPTTTRMATWDAKGSGTVTSVAMSVPTGLSISGSPITTSGTLGLTYTAGYAGVLTASTTNWNTFYNASNTFALLASPTFTGSPAAPTASAGDSTTLLATTAFVQEAIRSVPSKEASNYATTAALPAIVYDNGASGVGATLTGVSVGALTVDGNSPAVGQRILVKDQVSTFQNGIYTVTATGSGIAVFVLTRATDFNQTIDIKTGATTYVVSGTVYAGTTWDVSSADNPVMGTDAITFIQSAGPGSILVTHPILLSGSTLSLAFSTTTANSWSSLQTFTYASTTGISGTNSTFTNATSTSLAVTTTFNFLGTIITNVATWFSTTLNAVSSFVAVASSTWDFGGAASLEIPNGTAPTVDAVGEVALDTTDNQLLVGTSTSATPGVLRIVDTVAKFKVPSTSPMFATSSTTYFPTEQDGYTVTNIFCSVEGGTSKIITVFGESITCSTSGQTDDGAITINTIAAASTTVPFTAGNTSGVVNWLNVTVKGKWTRE